MKILIVDDDEPTLKVLKHTLELMKHVVCLARNSQEALRKFDNENPDLIMSDLMMPGLSGLSLLALLRYEKNCRIPIIAMSVLEDQPLIDSAFKSGANDYIKKPFQLTELKNKLDQFVNLHSI